LYFHISSLKKHKVRKLEIPSANIAEEISKMEVHEGQNKYIGTELLESSSWTNMLEFSGTETHRRVAKMKKVRAKLGINIRVLETNE